LSASVSTEKSATDAARKKDTEKSWRHFSKANFQEIFDSMDDAISLVGLDSKFIDTNKASLKQLGLTRAELLGKNVFDVIVPQDRQRAIESSRKVLETGKAVIQVGILRRDGTSFCGEISTTLIYDKDKKPAVFLGVTRDITERLETEEKLRERDQIYKAVFDIGCNPFVLVQLVYDKAGNPTSYLFLKVNNAFESLSGISGSQVLGKRVDEIYDADPALVKIFDDVAKTGKSTNVETYVQDRRMWFDLYAFRYAPNQVAVFFRDITSQKNLERQLQEKERLAAIGETAGMVGHDLRNPLQSIVGDLYLAENEISELPDGPVKASLKESIASISEQILYMDKIVCDLQTFVKPIEPSKEIVELKQLIDSTVTRFVFPQNISTRLCLDEKVKVEFDPQLLRRVFLNLITNAVQAMPNGGKLTIKSVDDGKGHVKIVFEDTGEGIPDEFKPKIFTPLFTTKSKGQGFGLAACKRIIEAQGGTINFESTPNKETKFTIELKTHTQT
jgi:PAS domain S-box-containing protein